MLIKMDNSGAGGGDMGGEVLHADLSGGNINVQWDFDAEALMVFMITDNNVTYQIYLVEVSTSNAWQAWNQQGWHYIGQGFSTWTITPRSVVGPDSSSINYLDVVPLKNMPNGYF